MWFEKLAFQAETLYLARRFCGLQRTHRQSWFTLVTLMSQLQRGETGVYATARILNVNDQTQVVAFIQ
jgi:hypothetical protein